VIAFASQYLQNRVSTRGPVPPVSAGEPTEVPAKRDPGHPGRPAQPGLRGKVPGTLDFWFENDTAAPVEMGLRDKSCKCTRVEVRVVPRGVEVVARRLVGGGAQRWAHDGAGVRHYAAHSGWAVPTVATTEWKPLDKTDAKGVIVPAEGAGWVSPGLEGRKAGAGGSLGSGVDGEPG